MKCFSGRRSAVPDTTINQFLTITINSLSHNRFPFFNSIVGINCLLFIVHFQPHPCQSPPTAAALRSICMAFKDAPHFHHEIVKDTNLISSSHSGILKTQNSRFQTQLSKQGRGLTNDSTNPSFNLNPSTIICNPTTLRPSRI